MADVLGRPEAEGFIGVFDSGVGGVSVLQHLVRELPGEDFRYFGDSAHAPYGGKTPAEVCELSRSIAERMLSEGAKALVIACNTATCAAAAQLRAEHPDLIIIGMEPALKLAHDQCPEGTILVLATPVSLASEKYRRLYENYGEHAVSLPCPGLMEFVERGETDTPALRDYLREKFAPCLAEGRAPAAVVLGCTHYVFLKSTVRALLPETTAVLDGNEGTVRQLARRLAGAGLTAVPGQSQGRFTLSFNAPGRTLTVTQRARTLLRAPE